MKKFIVISLIAINSKLTTSQSVNRQPQQNMIVNRPNPETFVDAPRAYVSQPLPIPYSPIDYKQVPLPPPQPLPVTAIPSTTIVTDCSPSVCKNLANTLQLMIVCSLLQNQKGGSETALQLASPLLNEFMSSPSLSCGCQNPLFSNPIPSTQFATPYNSIGPQIVTGYSNIATPTSFPNSGLLNLLSLFNN